MRCGDAPGWHLPPTEAEQPAPAVALAALPGSVGGMDAVPLHAQIVHMPLALSLLMPFLALGVLLAWRAELLPRRAWLIVVALQAVLFASAMFAERTGHQEEKRVKVAAAAALDEHEDLGETFAWISGVVLLMSLTVPSMANPAAAQALAAVAAGTMLVLSVLGYRAGASGLRLVYEHGAACSSAAAAACQAPVPGD
jgi:hypothetical protein